MKRFFYALLFVIWWIVWPSVADAASRFLTCNVTCTITPSDTTIWGSSSGGTGASVPGASDTVTLDAATCVGGVTCTATMDFGGTWTILSLTMGACTASTTGCIFDNSVNNNPIVFAAGASTPWSITGTGNRTIKCGTATYTVNMSGATRTVTAATITNLTFQCDSATLTWSGTGQTRVFNAGNLTWGTVTMPAIDTTPQAAQYTLSGNATYGTLNISAPNKIAFNAGSTITVTNAFAWTGTASNPLFITSDADAATTGITASASSTIAWGAIRNISWTGTVVNTNCINLGGNSGAGYTCTVPSTSSGGACIFGGWLMYGDIRGDRDNWPAFLDKWG